MTDLDEHLPAIAAGDASAFGRWLAGAERPIRDSLRPFATRIDTEAVLQEALLRLWQIAPRAVPDGRDNVLVRLGVRVAKNLAIDELRRARVTPTEIDKIEAALAADGDPHPAIPDPLLRRIIAECRAELPPSPGLALALRIDGDGGDPDETLAARAGMRLNTFLQNFTRARKLLGECLRRRGVDLVPYERAEGGTR